MRAWLQRTAALGVLVFGVAATQGCLSPDPQASVVPSASLAIPTAGLQSSVPTHFATLRPGAQLPSGEQCAAWVRTTSTPENRAVNKQSNRAKGHPAGNLFPDADDSRANSVVAPRIDGQFTGTTGQILRWAACKWGIDEDIVAAQAAVESWWRQTNLGDWDTDAALCPPSHGLGADGVAGKCPQSYGILQNRYPYERSSWPGIETSTAMNADTAYGVWRACYEGYEGWLNDVERVGQYTSGDVWGCVGRWFAGRWLTSAAQEYIGKVKDYLSRRVWERADFQEA